MSRGTQILMVAAAMGVPACGEDDTGNDWCGTGAVERNNTPGRAMSYSLGSEVDGCIGTTSDVRFYAITAPDDLTGGYVQASVIGTGVQNVRVTAYAGAGTAELARLVLTAGAGTAATFFLAVAPGDLYRLAIANEGTFTAPYTYKLMSTYTKVPDGLEPNDTPETATSVAPGAQTQAYLFAGLRDNPGAYDDYYRFSSIAERVTITIDDVPGDMAPRITLFGPDGMELARVASGLKGGRLVMQSRMTLQPGDHVVRVAPWSGEPESTGVGSTLPDHFTRPYKLTITQP